MKLTTWAYAIPLRPSRTHLREGTAIIVGVNAEVRIIGRRLGGIVIVEPLGMLGWAIPVRAEHVVE